MSSFTKNRNTASDSEKPSAASRATRVLPKARATQGNSTAPATTKPAQPISSMWAKSPALIHQKAGALNGCSAPAKTDGIPSLKEQGIDVVLGNWRGIFAAPGITPAQRDALVKLVQDATNTPAWKGTLEKMGWSGEFLAGDGFKAFLDQDTKRIAGIIDSLGIRK